MSKWIIIFATLIPLFGSTQTSSRIKTTHEVFNNLVQAYANGKGAPYLKIVPLKEKQVIAEYSTTSQGLPLIKIDQKLINICFSMGKDSLNALAFILSHELSHYYKDDNWCMDYAGFKFKTNPAVAKAIKEGEKYNKNKEILADKEGLVYARIAGYNSFNIIKRLLDSVYSKYKLQSNLSGYPTKSERKKLSSDASNDAQKWFFVFNKCLKYINDGKYKEAIDSLSYLTQKFPSREVYNNLGIAKVRKALILKPKTYEEVNFPERFLYPLEVENKTRLSREDNRGIDENSYEVMNKLLISAQKDFQEAIRIDPNFSKGYINLACVYDLLDNSFMAIGQIMQMSMNEQNSVDAKKILAISYYHNKQVDKAENIWKNLNK
jgi:tetratricopeptide (TPR) repeat protein